MSNRYTFSHANNLNNAHLGFSSGLQTDLNDLITNGGATEGVFYLTTDTHRLYIGRTIIADGATSVSKTIPIPVNGGIQTVDRAVQDPSDNTKTYLPSQANAGEFYYINDSNILAVYNGNQWVQINPNTNTDTEVSAASVSSGTEYQITDDTALVAGKTYYERSGSEGSYVYTAKENIAVGTNPHTAGYYEPYRVKYTLTINQISYDKISNATITSPGAVTADFYINSSDIANVLSISAGLITRDGVSNNTSEIALDGGISNGHTIKIQGGNNVSVSNNNTSDTITLSAPTYSFKRGNLSSDSVSIGLRKNGADISGSIFDITAGDHLSIDSTNTTDIVIHHDAPGAATQTVSGTDDQYGETANATKDLDGTESSTINIPTIKKDTYGHIASISESTITLNGIKNAVGNNYGQIVLQRQDNSYITSSDASLYHTITVDGATNRVYNQNSLGTFYSAASVDARIEQALQSANAMVYKGIVGVQDNGAILALPTSNVQVGDTYLVSPLATYIYTKTSDTELDNNKTYYALSMGGFVEVNAPTQGSLSSYYEKVPTSAADNKVEGGDLFIATGDEYAQTSDIAIDATKTYYTRSSGNAPYTYTKVTTPVVGNIGTYYENMGTIQGAITWSYVPSGDDIDTQFYIGNSSTESARKVSLYNDRNGGTIVSTLVFDSGTLITPKDIAGPLSGESAHTYHIGFNHNNSTVSAGSYGAGIATNTQTSFDGTNSNQFSIPSFTVDDYGHITAASTSTYTLPSIAEYRLNNNTDKLGTGTSDTTIRLWKDNAYQTISLVGDGAGGVRLSASANENESAININHSEMYTLTSDSVAQDGKTYYERTGSGTTSSPYVYTTLPSVTVGTTSVSGKYEKGIFYKDSLTAFSAPAGASAHNISDDTFSALTAVETDSYGHISAYKVTKFQLQPYSLFSDTANNNIATIALQKTGGNVGTVVSITSDNLTITSSSSNNAVTHKVNLEWGSFTSNTP